ncbi:baseplate J/gp47 family protein [Caballeronia sp. KNU42]
MATTYPLATLSAQITSAGISAPSYAEIFASLQASYQSIYGSDIYIDPDSQDGQIIGVFAQAISDCNQTAITVYNAFSPTYAQGAGLSSVVKINGIQREISTYSTALLTIVGQAGRTINNGIVQDASQNNWALPALVTIPPSGTISVTATCQTIGAITALPNTITNITTPQQGWQTATNPAVSEPGNPVEMDAALRQRQTISTSLPALTPLQAIIGNAANVVGVGRYAIYENPTKITDSNGIPANSIAVVVEGGDVTQIATAIEVKKSPGTGTYGTTSVIVYDPSGVPIDISFFELTEVPIFALIDITPLVGYLSTTGVAIEESVSAFIEALAIGSGVNLNKVLSPAGLQGNAAITATGLTQSQLTTLAATYDIDSVYMARADMSVIGGPYGAGAVAVSVTNPTNFSVGQGITLIASDSSQIAAAVTSVVGSVVGFSPAIPSGKTINNGALIYVAGNLAIAFTEAAACSSANILLST